MRKRRRTIRMGVFEIPWIKDHMTSAVTVN
jgi:hypothetical protein